MRVKMFFTVAMRGGDVISEEFATVSECFKRLTHWIKLNNSNSKTLLYTMLTKMINNRKSNFRLNGHRFDMCVSEYCQAGNVLIDQGCRPVIINPGRQPS